MTRRPKLPSWLYVHGCSSFQLMTVPQQGSQIPLFRRRHPDRGEVSFREQIQDQARIPPIMLLLPRLGRPDLRRMADPDIQSPTRPVIPRTTASIPWLRFLPPPDLLRSVKVSYRTPFVEQRFLHELTTLCVHHGYALLSCMQSAALYLVCISPIRSLCVSGGIGSGFGGRPTSLMPSGISGRCPATSADSVLARRGEVSQNVAKR